MRGVTEVVKGAAVLAAICIAALVVPGACSGTQQATEVIETLDELEEAVTTAREALEAARPILEEAGETETEREKVARVLDAVEGVLELGEALVRDLGHATQRGGWAWADAILGALSGVLGLLKSLGAPIPDAVIRAAGAAELLVPAIGEVVAPAGGT